MFGAFKEGADCTSRMQEMADEAAAIGAVIDGYSQQYNVGTIKWPSGSKVQNLRLKCIAATFDFTAPVTIDGISSPKRGYRFRNVHVDGNRESHTAIETTIEDGGRHGWRLIGRISDLLAVNCSAIGCAGDGLALYSGKARGTEDTDPCFRDIIFINFVSEGNRRHGWSADSFANLRFIGGSWRRNGKDLSETDAYSVGMRGARSDGTPSGNLYGRPFDVEDYGIGSGWDGLWINGADCRENVTGVLIHAHVNSDPLAAGFSTRKNLYMRSCQLDEPSNRWRGFPLQIYSSWGASGGTGLVFENLNFVGNHMSGGPVNIRNASGGISGGFIDTGGMLVRAVLTDSPNFVVTSPSDAVQDIVNGRFSRR